MNARPQPQQELSCSREQLMFQNCLQLKIFENKCIMEKFEFIQCIQKETPYVAVKLSDLKKIETFPAGIPKHQQHQATDDDRGLSLGSFTP
jgi:hypothetical protein